MIQALRQIIAGSRNQGLSITESNPNNLRSDTNVKFGVIHALNGKIIEISTYKPNHNGPDWTHECYIVKDGETLAEAMAVVIMMKGLER